jgi:hypothetical protein
MRERSAKWYVANSDLIKGRTAAYAAAHPLRVMLYAARYAVKLTKLRLETME